MKGPTVDIEQAMRDARDRALWGAAHRRRRGVDRTCLVGYGIAIVGDRLAVPFRNLITTTGDEYYVKKGIVGISPANASAPTAVSGMKLGTGTTTPSKSGAGAALVTYLTGSNRTFDTGYPTATVVTGTDQGWQATYQCTWPAGTATNAAITECALVTDAASNATSAASATIARGLFGTAVNKGADEPLITIWQHEFQGS